MPYTGWTMLIGCLAIIGAGVPFVLGFSGYYSKDAILAQALLFSRTNPQHSILYLAVAGGAFITAFYMFRLWFMTFAGSPRDQHVFEHARIAPSYDSSSCRAGYFCRCRRLGIARRAGCRKLT